jgi:hypothetical protein
MQQYLNTWLISPLEESPFKTDLQDKDQMRFEKKAREQVAVKDLPYPGDMKKNRWSHYYSFHNAFVDRSTFYSTLTYVRFDATCLINSENACTKKAILWTYAAVTVWVNGQKVVSVAVPAYKPIIKQEFTLSLRKGINEIWVCLQNLGVRDTRTLFAIELSDGAGCISLWPEWNPTFTDAVAILDGTHLENRTLQFPKHLPAGSSIGYDSNSPDFAQVKTRVVWHDATGCLSFVCETGNPYIKVRIPAEGETVQREFEIAEAVVPTFSDVHDIEGNYRRMLSVIASAEALSRGDKFGFSIQNILARKALGRETEKDHALFLETLQQIEDRYDCSDFLISGVIRYVNNYPVDVDLEKRIHDVLIGYRYWMTMEGSDAMCFWSENHSLLFYSCAVFAGERYPDETFPRAHMTGRELAAFGRKLCIEWFNEVDQYGFEEFLSTVYMNVTFACLLNIVDYGDAELSERAVKATDKLIDMLAQHVFDGAVIAPMGRVYRGVINPTKQGAQALMNLVNPEVPTSFGEGWLSYYATSKYKIPKEAKELMSTVLDMQYSSGDALICLKKTHAYCLTSVQSPRLDGFQRWENITLEPDAQRYENTHTYTKSFNERFHGTTFFQPGVYGYQQHMWTAALSMDAILFVNHPGAFCDDSSMRPGYWYGNGVMPALKQQGKMLGVVYQISESHPIKFTHVYMPACKFDTVIYETNCIFARKNSGYLALWTSEKLLPYDDQLSHCEMRNYGTNTAYLVLVGSDSEDGTFDAFINHFRSLNPSYEKQAATLFIAGQPYITYVSCHDDTQFV